MVYDLRVDGVLLGTFETLVEAKAAFSAAVNGLVQRDWGHFQVTWTGRYTDDQNVGGS